MPGADSVIAERSEALLQPIEITRKQEISALATVMDHAAGAEDLAELIDMLGLNHRKVRTAPVL